MCLKFKIFEYITQYFNLKLLSQGYRITYDPRFRVH